MSNQSIEQFAQLLVRQVRDEAIRACDRYLSTDNKSPVGERWASMGIVQAHREEVKTIVSDCVDEVVFTLLQAIDQEMMSLKFMTDDGDEVDLPTEGLGELGGWYMCSGGWRAMYSTERFIDDFADLGKSS